MAVSIIKDLIQIKNVTICDNVFTYEIEVTVNFRDIISQAKEIDNNFNNWKFYVEVSVKITDNGMIALLDGFYFYNSKGQPSYMIVGLNPYEWKLIENYAKFETSKII